MIYNILHFLSVTYLKIIMFLKIKCLFFGYHLSTKIKALFLFSTLMCFVHYNKKKRPFQLILTYELCKNECFGGSQL